MRLPVLVLLALPICCLAQNKTSETTPLFKKVFPVKKDSVHYETSFFLQIPQDTLFARTEEWMRSQKEFHNVLKPMRIIFPTYILHLRKVHIGVRVPFNSRGTKTNSTNANTVFFLYNLKVYLKAETVVQIMAEEVRMAGDIKAIGLKLPETHKDTLYVEDYEKALKVSLSNGQSKTGVNNEAVAQSFKLVDVRIKKDIAELIKLLNKKPEEPVAALPIIE